MPQQPQLTIVKREPLTITGREVQDPRVLKLLDEVQADISKQIDPASTTGAAAPYGRDAQGNVIGGGRVYGNGVTPEMTRNTSLPAMAGMTAAALGGGPAVAGIAAGGTSLAETGDMNQAVGTGLLNAIPGVVGKGLLRLGSRFSPRTTTTMTDSPIVNAQGQPMQTAQTTTTPASVRIPTGRVGVGLSGSPRVYGVGMGNVNIPSGAGPAITNTAPNTEQALRAFLALLQGGR